MFFYQARLRYRFGLEEPIASALISPSLPGGGALPDLRSRSIQWKATKAIDSHALQVLSIPLESVLGQLADEASTAEAVQQAPEVLRFLRPLLPDIAQPLGASLRVPTGE
jgi:hypothetical protein